MVPMILPFMMVLAVGFLPAVLLEAFFLKKGIGLSWIPAVQGSFVVNLFSGLFGVPCTWLTLLFVQVASGAMGTGRIDTLWGKLAAVTLHAPCISVFETSMWWIYPLAALYLSIIDGVSVAV